MLRNGDVGSENRPSALGSATAAAAASPPFVYINVCVLNCDARDRPLHNKSEMHHIGPNAGSDVICIGFIGYHGARDAVHLTAAVTGFLSFT